MRRKKKKTKKKDSLKETERDIKKIVIIAVSIILFLLLVSFFTGIKIRFIIHDELSISLTPLDQSYTISNNDSVLTKFTVHNNNFFNCKSICNFNLKSVSSNETLFSKEQELKHQKSFSQEFVLFPPSRGSGQVIYNFEVECHNIKTFICLTDETPRHKNAIVTLNYNLSSKEQLLVPELKSRLEGLTDKKNRLAELIDENNLLKETIPDYMIDANQIFKKTKDYPSHLIVIEKNLENHMNSWFLEDYFGLSKKFPKKELSEVNELIISLEDSNKELRELVELRNQNLNFLIFFDILKEKINNAVKEYEQEFNLENHNHLKTIEETSGKIINIYESIINNNPMSQSSLEQETVSSNNMILEILIEHENLVQQRNIIGKIYSQKLSEMNISETYDCDDLKVLSKKVDLVNQANKINNSNVSITNQNNTINNTNLTKFIKIHCKDEKYNKTITLTKANQLLNTTFSLLETKKIIIPHIKSEIEQTHIQLNPPICCVNNECKPCCEEGCEKKVPILFIHGHAVNDANKVEYSMNVFSKIQIKLEKQGLVNLGQLDLIKEKQDTMKGEWGKINYPITVKASYYYITYYDLGKYSISTQKTEGIENYAIRLKEIIELLKYRTGSEKVTIVAHSMGGLVTREYASLFGYESISKIILINTPNHGVEGKIDKYCSILGADKECNDLSSKSIFIQRLNSKEIPDDSKIYSIRSTGCEMDNEKNGDGVVTEESAYLEGATNYEIKGECTDSLKTDLHSNVLDPELYPGMYELLADLIKR